MKKKPKYMWALRSSRSFALQFASAKGGVTAAATRLGADPSDWPFIFEHPQR